MCQLHSVPFQAQFLMSSRIISFYSFFLSFLAGFLFEFKLFVYVIRNEKEICDLIKKITDVFFSFCLRQGQRMSRWMHTFLSTDCCIITFPKEVKCMALKKINNLCRNVDKVPRKSWLHFGDILDSRRTLTFDLPKNSNRLYYAALDHSLHIGFTSLAEVCCFMLWNIHTWSPYDIQFSLCVSLSMSPYATDRKYVFLLLLFAVFCMLHT